MCAKPDISVRIASLQLKNPVIAASGVFGYGQEYAGLIDDGAFGALVTKGISLAPAAGNPGPRIVETPSGMLNAIGLQNLGLKAFISDKMPLLRTGSTPVIVNFYGTTIDEYIELAGRLSEVQGIAALEANISCPNVKQGGISFGTDARMAADITARIRSVTRLPLIVKLTPNVTDIAEIARSVEQAGADAVSLINTLTGMVIDPARRRPVLANITGGLSGPAIRPIAVRMVWQVFRAVTIPVIGLGGIMNAADALQFLIAGACAVQVGTGLFVDPSIPASIVTGVQDYMTAHGFKRLEQLTGSLLV
jgi:dihydroorotate dehydrogenase (NAD+) catalytic subunit